MLQSYLFARPFRVVGLAAGCLAAGACASVSGLDGYSACSEGCTDAMAATLDGPEEIDAGDAADDSPALPPDGGCAAGLTACGDQCVDLTSPSNCGNCGNACTTSIANAQPTCTTGTCSFACNAGFGLCGGACIRYTTAVNCGGCGNVCSGSTPVCGPGGDAGAEAGGYTCLSGCPAATPTPCSGSCVDLASNASHCGTCTTACPTSVANAAPDCVGRACTFKCNSGYALCSGSCIDTTTSAGNCGVCGHACSTSVANATATCASSVCGFTCNNGFSLCNGACVNEKTDNNNCGGCGLLFACAPGHTCQGGLCKCNAPTCAACTAPQAPCCTSLGVCGCALSGATCM